MTSTFELQIPKSKKWDDPNPSDAIPPFQSEHYDAFIPNTSGFKMQKIVNLIEKDGKLFLEVEIPNEPETREVDLNMMRIMYPELVAEFLAEKYLD